LHGLFFMKKTQFLFVLLFFPSLIFAQNLISYNIEKNIVELEQQYIESWKKVKKIEGFRIQITTFSGINSKTSIESVAEQFKQQFPDIPFFITYAEPNFRLRVGNFRTKIEAYRALQKISLTFSGAFVLKDQIDFK